MKKIEHIGIAVKDIAASNKVFSTIFGKENYKAEKVELEGVVTSFFQIGESKIELVAATKLESPIAKYLGKNRESLHHIAFDVADIEKAVKGGAGHCFLNSGQSCNAPTRMLVSSTNYDKAVEVAVATANKTTVGDPNGEFRMGPIANKAQYEKVVRMIEIGVEEGATLVAGGPDKPEGCDKGYFVKPTVFANVTNDMTIAREEIFGPVLSIIKYETEEEAIAIANDTEFGLAGYIQGELSHAQNVAKKIRAGQITINGGARGSSAPFGGYKTSGHGREHGVHGIDECLETKAVIIPLG